MQQECESAMCELPHISLMCWQQSLSSSVICWPGRTQATSGAESTSNARIDATNLRPESTSPILSKDGVPYVSTVTAVLSGGLDPLVAT